MIGAPQYTNSCCIAEIPVRFMSTAAHAEAGCSPWNAATKQTSLTDCQQEATATGYSAIADAVVSSIYESPRLNRLFAEEYLAYFETHGFNATRIDGWPTDASIDRTLLPQARARYPHCENLEWDGSTCVLTKS